MDFVKKLTTKFVRWWNCIDHIEFIQGKWGELHNAARERHEQHIQEMSDFYKNREERLIQSHRQTHDAFDRAISEAANATIRAHDGIERFANKLAKDGHTVKAEELMSIVDPLIWAFQRESFKVRSEKFPVNECAHLILH